MNGGAIIECVSCGETVEVLDGYCLDCSQAWELETCLHCGQHCWVNVWGECDICESDICSQFRRRGERSAATLNKCSTVSYNKSELERG